MHYMYTNGKLLEIDMIAVHTSGIWADCTSHGPSHFEQVLDSIIAAGMALAGGNNNDYSITTWEGIVFINGLLVVTFMTAQPRSCTHALAIDHVHACIHACILLIR